VRIAGWSSARKGCPKKRKRQKRQPLIKEKKKTNELKLTAYLTIPIAAHRFIGG
jgi:hypothetical protein